MRRHLSNYFKNLPHFKETRQKLVTSLNVEELLRIIDGIPEQWQDEICNEVEGSPLSI
jgi:hypothetical protein